MMTNNSIVKKEVLNQWKEQYFQDLLLTGSPIPMAVIVLCYLLFVLKIGPNYMQNRTAFNLKNLMITYNTVIIVISSYIFILMSKLIWKFGLFDKTCVSQAEQNFEELMYAGYCYFYTKVFELFDTVFFVLRKKQDQVTFLHVYHHALLAATMWGYLKFETSSVLIFLGALNSFVHVVMYTYYVLAVIPAMKEYLWWKKYLTSMQMIQFALALIHMMVFRMTTECQLTNFLFTAIFINLVIFIGLFLRFYRNAYLTNTKLNLTDFVCFNIDQSDCANDLVSLENKKQE